MWQFANVKPTQIKPIEWGWTNEQDKDGNLWVKEPLGRIEMPTLLDKFDWSHFEVFCPPEQKYLTLGTVNFKSVFTTAARFLGYEQLLVDQPDLTPISDSYFEWNHRLLQILKPLTWFVIGDDIASNAGLMMSPALWREWVKPHSERLITLALDYGCQVVYHSDGDISEVVDDLVKLNVTAIDGQRIGHMVDLLDKGNYNGVTIVENSDPMATGERKGWR